jgi:hypothetical protein
LSVRGFGCMCWRACVWCRTAVVEFLGVALLGADGFVPRTVE